MLVRATPSLGDTAAIARHLEVLGSPPPLGACWLRAGPGHGRDDVADREATEAVGSCALWVAGACGLAFIAILVIQLTLQQTQLFW